MKQKIYIICGIILVLLLGLVISFFDLSSDSYYEDVLRFKKEYESLNNKTDKSGNKYKNVKIDKKSRINYLDDLDEFNLFESGSALIFIGEEDNIETRNVVEVLLSTVNSSELKELLYLPNKNIKDGDYGILLDILKSYNKEITSIDIPLLFAVKDGEVLGILNEKYSVSLTKEDEKFLKKSIINLIELLNDNEDNVCLDAC